MASLVIAEHDSDNASLKDATHKTVTAAAEISSPVHVLVAGEPRRPTRGTPGSPVWKKFCWRTPRLMRANWPSRWKPCC